jgi:hypothetical protein
LSALVYDADRRLCERGRVVVDYEDVAGETYARLLLGGQAFDIVRRGRLGWHFSLVAARDGSTFLSFVPARVRRGGCLHGDGAEVALHPRPLRARRWRFTSTAGWQVQAHMRVSTGRDRQRDSTGSDPPAGAIWSGFVATVELDGLETVGASVGTPLALAFACWLLVESESQAFGAGGGGGG